MRLDDPALVAQEYGDEDRLRTRARIYGSADAGAADARDVAVAALAELEPRRVLEVGCGWGELAERVERELGTAVTAADLSPRMVELARGRGVDAQVADVQELPFTDGEFDAAVAAWMLYHVPDLDRGLSELARVLRPGGRLVAITVSRFHLYELRTLVGSGPPPLSFSRESGEELLAQRFETIRREDVGGTVVFETREDVVRYVSASMTMGRYLDNLPAELDEPFRARRAVSVFIADR